MNPIEPKDDVVKMAEEIRQSMNKIPYNSPERKASLEAGMNKIYGNQVELPAEVRDEILDFAESNVPESWRGEYADRFFRVLLPNVLAPLWRRCSDASREICRQAWTDAREANARAERAEAELEEANDRLARCRHNYDKDVQAIAFQLAVAEKDSKRLDWLQNALAEYAVTLSRGHLFPQTADTFYIHCHKEPDREQVWYKYKDNVRSAIDAARRIFEKSS